jgi:protein SCO1/2
MRKKRARWKKPMTDAFIFGYAVCMLLLPFVVWAKETPPNQNQPPDVGIDQQLDVQVPLDITLRDEQGQAVRLGHYFRDEPVILMLGYYECPMLCSLARRGLFDSLQALQFSAGDQFHVVSVSIDPREDAHTATIHKAMHLQSYNRPGAAQGVHFLTGDEGAISRLADAVGFRYEYDEQTGQYAHPSGVMVLTPQGRVSRYLYGIEYDTQDLRLALVEAADNQIGSPTDQVLLLCYQYNPTTGQYSLAIWRLVRIAGVATALVLVTAVIVLARRGRRRLPSPHEPPAQESEAQHATHIP